ncbi:MAG: flagellar biosynthesis regulator FlaF [Pseudomonadota bacterium]|nr:flagellar biosynthesis regulator FlaF [Pseudomonadota bacterium]MDP1905960.1 flagellar biosynthesis regulator FlaF [Pseudomonadota bacterium]MDP2351878.1 flagellar biosynthesis regulator FlaF [Pseudomonadota bacterium]
MPANPLDAYRSVEKATLSQRDLEATVLTKAAQQLQQLKDNWTREDHDAQLEDALSYNQRVWTFFQAELSVEDNPLPEEIRRNLLALSFFVDRRSFEVLAYPAPEKLDILISINNNVAAGLRGDAG